VSARAEYYAKRSSLRRTLRALRKMSDCAPRSNDIAYRPGEVEGLRSAIVETRGALTAMSGRDDIELRWREEAFRARFASLKAAISQRRAEQAKRARMDRHLRELDKINSYAREHGIPYQRLLSMRLSLGLDQTAAEVIAADAARYSVTTEAA